MRSDYPSYGADSGTPDDAVSPPEWVNEGSGYHFDVIVPTTPSNRYECSCPPVFENDVLRQRVEELEVTRKKARGALEGFIWLSVPFFLLMFHSVGTGAYYFAGLWLGCLLYCCYQIQALAGGLWGKR